MRARRGGFPILLRVHGGPPLPGRTRTPSRAEHVRSIFRAFDVRRAGYISLDDAIDAFAVAVPAVSPAVVADVFAAADVDGDGKVSREEFAALLAGGSGTGHTTHT